MKGAHCRRHTADGEGRWGARIRIKGQAVVVGYWPTAEAAARAYDHVAISLKVRMLSIGLP